MKRNNHIERIMRLDEEITELVKKRSTLLNSVRVKGYVPSDVEKELRQHWERYASEKTKDTSFVRNLFKILQQVEMQECGELNPGKFMLTPSKATVNDTIEGTVTEDFVHLALLYSAVRRVPITLKNVAISDYVFATIKTFQSLGIGITWEQTTIATHSFNIAVDDVVVHLAESEISLYILLAFSINTMGHIKCVGGLSLSMLSLTLCKEVLAQCGVRVTSLGGVSGIPARIESTKQIPKECHIPPTLPKMMVLALSTLFAASEESCSLFFQNHAEKDDIEHTMKTFFDAIGVQYAIEEYGFSFSASKENNIEIPLLPLDPYQTFVRAVIPYFTGGSITIQGFFPDYGIYTKIIQQLEQCGLHVLLTKESITISKVEEPNTIDLTLLPQRYFPILLTMFLTIFRSHHTKILPSIPEGIDPAEVQSFLEALDIDEVNGKLTLQKEPSHLPWIAPNAYWIIGYAYAGFLFPGITLANPSDVTTVLPNFWRLYNTLPNPVEYEEQPVQEEIATTKRRVIVR